MILVSVFFASQLSLAAHVRDWTTWSCTENKAPSNSIMFVFDTDGSKAALTVCGASCDGKPSDTVNFEKTVGDQDIFTDSKGTQLTVPSITDGLANFTAILNGVNYTCM